MQIKRILTIATMTAAISFAAACGNEKDGVVSTQDITSASENTSAANTEAKEESAMNADTESKENNTGENTTEKSTTDKNESADSTTEKDSANTQNAEESTDEQTSLTSEEIADAETNAEQQGGAIDLRDYAQYQLADYANAERMTLAYDEAADTYTGLEGNLTIAPTPLKDGYMITLSGEETAVEAYGARLGMSADEVDQYWTSQGMIKVTAAGNIQYQIEGNEKQYLVFYQSEDGTVEKIEYTCLN